MPIYSEYAIERAKSSEIVLENTTYLLYNMLCAKLLKDVINLDYTKRYVVMFPVSLFDKSKKSGKYLRLLDNDLCRDKINLCFNYKQMNGHFIILKSLIYTYLGSINNKHIKEKI